MISSAVSCQPLSVKRCRTCPSSAPVTRPGSERVEVHELRCLASHGLLTDTPSLDRIHDDGKLAAHRVFWGLRGSSHSLDDALRPSGTITELIYVPDEIVDGLYLLNLQLPAFVTDAAPSRPVLFRTELV